MKNKEKEESWNHHLGIGSEGRFVRKKLSWRQHLKRRRPILSIKRLSFRKGHILKEVIRKA